jgi:ABC-type amino acid transport substrate-binding protein
MKKGMKSLCYFLAIILLSWITINEVASATEPRITPGLLSPERLEIFTYENPPLASMDMPSGGLYPEIIQAALNKENVKATVTILPVRSLVKYNLIQDNAIAIIGDGWNFSEEERKRLIFIPFCIINGGYYYYRPAHKQELSLDGNISKLKGLTYGAQEGEDVTAFKEAGLSVRFGSVLSHYKKLKGKEIDFLSAPGLSAEWIVSKHYSGEKNNYLLIKNSSWEASSPIIFNTNNIEAKTVSRKLREGLIKIKLDGTYINILEKYHGEGSTPKDYFLRLERHQKETESQNRWSQ